MVPSTGALSTLASAVLSGLPATPNFVDALGPAHATATNRQITPMSNLALNGDLMFDQSDVPPHMKETLW